MQSLVDSRAPSVVKFPKIIEYFGAVFYNAWGAEISGITVLGSAAGRRNLVWRATNRGEEGFMGGRFCRYGLVVLFLSAAEFAAGQTISLDGSSMALRSYANSTVNTNYGNNSGTDAVLNTIGYVGTYITLAAPTTLTLNVNATGTTNDATLPRLGISVDDSLYQASVTSGSNDYSTNVTLPAGTHFVRLQYDNDADSDPISGNNHSLTIHNFQVTGAASFANTNNSTNALAASNTYIQNFRKGTANVATGFASGQQVTVKMLRNDFNFGTNVTGASNGALNNFIGGPTTSQQINFQNYLNKHFNMLVTSNMGKWSLDEATQNTLTMTDQDQMLSYAKNHNMTARAHNLIWGAQQPTFVNNLLSTINSGSSTPAQKAAALASLNTAIDNRIGYFVAGGDPASTNTTSPGNQLVSPSTVGGVSYPNTNDVRVRDYSEIDVLNEPLNNNPYIKALGVNGIASVYNRVKTAANNASANTTLFANEYNVIQNSPLYYNSSYVAQGTDSYASWYTQYINNVNNAGYGKVVTGAAVEWYPTVTDPTAVNYQQVFQNLSVLNMPISIPEGGVNGNISSTNAVQIVDDALRMMYGTPNATTFMLWSTWAGATSSMNSASVMVDSSWNLTAVGKRWEYLFGQGLDPTAVGVAQDQANADGSNPHPWNTADQTASVDGTGHLSFTGAYGEYALQVGGVTYATVSFEKGAAFPVLWVKGDYNLDGQLTVADIQAALNALKNQNRIVSGSLVNGYQAANNMSNEEYVAICDTNGDGLVNAKDILGLEQLLASGIQAGNGVFGGGAFAAVPEPTSAVLAVLAFGLATCGMRRRRALGS